MAERSFSINTTPHIANIGSTSLLFQPEVVGADFAQAYSLLKEAQKKISAAGDDAGADELRSVYDGMRQFVTSFLLPESVAVFEALRLPDRILVQLLEWSAELYGGGTGSKENPTVAPGGQSSES